MRREEGKDMVPTASALKKRAEKSFCEEQTPEPQASNEGIIVL